MKTIVITSDKGGVGKSTIAAIIVEWLNHNNTNVNLIDADPIQTTQTWIDNCKADGRTVTSHNAEYLIVDTAGTSGAGLSWLQKSDIIISPFQPHYADIKTLMDWFYTININLQKKVFFIPNRYQKTNEQKEGIRQITNMIKDENTGSLLSSLSNRPAIYGTLLNGNSINFFDSYSDKSSLVEAKNLMKSLLVNL